MTVRVDEVTGLAAAELEAFVAKEVADQLQVTQAVAKPRAFLTGGQPGSGKSRVKQGIGASLDHTAGIIEIDPDNLRPKLPYMQPFINSGASQIPEAANRDASTAAHAVLKAAAAAQRNILRDGTMKDAESAVAMTKGLRDAGYSVEFHGMAVHPRVSHARIYERCESQIERSPTRFGRRVNDEFHDLCVAGYANTVEELYRQKLVDRIALYDENSERILDMRLEGDRWVPAPGFQDMEPAQAVRVCQSEPAPESILHMAVDTWDKVLRMMNVRAAQGQEVAADLDQATRHRAGTEAALLEAQLQSALESEAAADHSKGREREPA